MRRQDLQEMLQWISEQRFKAEASDFVTENRRYSRQECGCAAPLLTPDLDSGVRKTPSRLACLVSQRDLEGTNAESVSETGLERARADRLYQ